MSNKTIGNNIEFSRKRSLSSTFSNESNKKSSRSKRYKSLLTCVICDGDAHGYNFDAISCESCKAFFRRNALHPLEKLKCRGSGRCSVKFDVRKRCKRCRLEKCLQSGMRKEWILSDKEREEKRIKIEQNRRLKQMQDNNPQHQEPSPKRNSKTSDELSPMLHPSFLQDLDWFKIQNIQDCFIEAVKLNQIAGIAVYPSSQPIESTSELFRIPLYISSMRLISFIKQIDEFPQLDKKEQVHLIKLNLLTVCFFHSLYIYDPRTDAYHEEDTSDPLFTGKDWNKTLNKQFHLQMKQIRNDLLEIFQMDNIIIKLCISVILLSHQMSSNQSSQCIYTDIDSMNIFKVQNIYTDLIYRYCLHRYGPYKAPVLFCRYMMKIMSIQQLVDQIKYQVHDYMDVTELSPLTQSLIV